MKTMEALDKYLRGKVLKPTTVTNITRSMTLLSEFEQELPMSAALLNEWIVWLANEHHLNDNSRKTHLNAIRAVYSYLAKIYEWEKNPASKTESVKTTQTVMRTWTPDELFLIYSNAKTDFYKTLYGALLDSSARVSELASLHISKLSQDGFICEKSRKTGEHFYRCRPEILQSMRKIANTTTGYIFTYPDGKPLSAHTLAEKIHRNLKIMGIKGKKIGAHTFRHTAATLVADESDSPFAVQALTGHADIKMAEKYVHQNRRLKAQKYSPLEIAGKTFQENQPSTALMPLTTPPEPTNTKEIVVNADGIVISTGNNQDEWLENMFTPTPNKIIRPVLKPNDLDFVRHLLKLAVASSPIQGDDVKARDFWKRITRKA